METLDFYFDFISPYGYFGSLVVDDVAARNGLAVNWRVMLLGVSVLKVMKLPPLAERPLIGDYHIRHAIPRYAMLHGIRLNRDLGAPPPSPLLAARCFCLLKEHDEGTAVAFAKSCLRAHWDGADILGDLSYLIEAAGAAGGDRRRVLEGMQNGLGAKLLREAMESALARGVFGSPMFLIGDEPFHGVDSLPILGLWLARRRKIR